MFALRKIFVGTLCALLGVMPVFADSNNNSFVDEYVGHMSGFFNESFTEETVGIFAREYHKSAIELLDRKMLPETQKFVGALCNRMQKYIRDNSLEVYVSVPACDIPLQDALGFDCNRTDSCMVLITLQMAKGVKDPFKEFMSDQCDFYKWVTELAGKDLEYSRVYKYGKEEDKSVECSEEKSICVINQGVYLGMSPRMYYSCCLLNKEGRTELLSYGLLHQGQGRKSLDYCLKQLSDKNK